MWDVPLGALVCRADCSTAVSRPGQPAAPTAAARCTSSSTTPPASDAPAPATTAGQAIAAGILADLQRQRQQIEHARQQAQQTDANVAATDSTLKRMSQWWRLW